MFSNSLLSIFIWVALLCLFISILVWFLVFYFKNRRPSSHEILEKFPLSFDVEEEYSEINRELIQLIEQQIKKDVRYGAQVAAFYKGKQIINIYGILFFFLLLIISLFHNIFLGGAGYFENQGPSGTQKEWKKITKDTLFMSYSLGIFSLYIFLFYFFHLFLVKGISAIVLAFVLQNANINYHDKISTFWPSFGKCGKENVTIAEAVSHRAGLKSAPPIFDVLSTIIR